MDSNRIDTPELPPGYEILRNDMGFSEHIGPFYVRKPLNGHTLAFGFRVAPKHVNRGGVVHGGMLVSFIDHALGAMVFTAAGRKPCSTISLDCNFVSPARPGDWVECTGEIGRVTLSIVFIDGKLRVGDRVVMQAKGIWKVLDKWLGEKTK
jgi:uncharacterized protein (TIGR00369 family)